VADDLDPTAVERAALVRLLEPGIAGTWLTPRAARRVQDALAAAGPLVTPEHDAQVAARASFSAWHHGWAAGWKDHQRRTDDLDAYAQEGSTPNPYRIERQDVTR